MSFLKKLFGGGASKRSTAKDPIYSDNTVLNLGVKFIDEYIATGVGSYQTKKKLSDLQSWTEVKRQDNALKANFCHAAILKHLSKAYLQRGNKDKSYLAQNAESRIPGLLMRKPLPFSERQLRDMILECCKRTYLDYDNPIKNVLKSTEAHFKDRDVADSIKSTLKKVIKKSHSGYSDNRDVRTIRDMAEKLLSGVSEFQAPSGPWTEKFLGQIDDKSIEIWNPLLQHAMSASGSEPTKKWITQADAVLKPIGTAIFQKTIIQWIDNTKTEPVASDAHTDLAKGLVWISATIKLDEMALALGRLGNYCFIKIAGHGQRNQALGNACTVALTRMATLAAISELIRLRDKNKYATTKAAIEKKLEEIALAKNITLSELEAKSLPDFGFDAEGCFEKTLGEYSARIDIAPGRASLKWFDKDAKPRKTIPKAVRDNFKKDIADLKNRTKDISGVISGQLTALEQSWLNNLSWSAQDWKALYLEHPVRTQMTRSLIWTLTQNDKTTAFMAEGQKLVDLSGAVVKLPKDGTIALWHPVNAPPKIVLKWRKIIEDRKITQPIRQAHREVYVLTDAERNTDIYSNRFAAHIVRQYQFKALCAARFWKYTVQGQWDSYNIPVKTLRAHNMLVEYHVEAAVEDEVSGTGIYMYLATDQVRFFTAEREQLSLSEIPPIVFSEIMRDVDLFVAVTSVANDPNWTDGGPDGRFGQYWIRQAFGNLGETAKMRKTLIEGLVPKLAIKDKLKVTEKYLEVQGRKNKYQIHFGSGNIMIMPDNRYLCIVRGANSKKEDKIYLPFEGDTMLSVILSKALLLANDDKITDKTILSQLGR